MLVALHRLPAEFWYTLTRLGEMQLLLPIGMALIAWLAWSGERARAAGWLALLLAAVGITTASKIARSATLADKPALALAASDRVMASTSVLPDSAATKYTPASPK